MARTPSDLGSAALAAAARCAVGGGRWERGIVSQSVRPSVRRWLEAQAEPPAPKLAPAANAANAATAMRPRQVTPRGHVWVPAAHFRLRLVGSAHARSALRIQRPPWRAQTPARRGRGAGWSAPAILGSRLCNGRQAGDHGASDLATTGLMESGCYYD